MRILQPPPLDHDAMMAARFGHSTSPRGRCERRLVFNLLTQLESLGFKLVHVFDGDSQTPVTSPKDAMELMFNLDDCYVFVKKAGHHAHWIRFVFGNSGWDSINDHSYLAGDPDGFLAFMDAFDGEAFA